jgi:hypothetical protein
MACTTDVNLKKNILTIKLDKEGFIVQHVVTYESSQIKILTIPFIGNGIERNAKFKSCEYIVIQPNALPLLKCIYLFINSTNNELHQ